MIRPTRRTVSAWSCALSAALRGGIVLALVALAAAGGAAATPPAGTSQPAASQPASSPAATTQPAKYPKIAMYWSPATMEGDRWQNIARHHVIIMNIEDLGFAWDDHEFAAMAETIKPQSIQTGRDNLRRIRRLNPSAVVLCEVYFFEERDGAYPPDSDWWLRDRKGNKVQFWPGTHQMDLGNAEYVAHIVRRIVAVNKATAGEAGVFLDNLRFDKASKLAWTGLLRQVRALCGDMPIQANAGWTSDDLAWVAPLVNGIQYEDSIAHLADGDTEKYYARIAATDALVKSPRISANELYGADKDGERMRRELLRTLVYTDMDYLYAKSTHGHNHLWHGEWDAPLGTPKDKPAQPRAGELARRNFTGGTVLWLPQAARGPLTVSFGEKMRSVFTNESADSLVLQPGTGAILVKSGK